MNMKHYPIAAPESVPTYVTASVQAKCDTVLTRVFAGVSVEDLRRDYMREMESELDAMRCAHDGNASSGKEWYSWGLRTVTNAFRHAVCLAEFRDALASPNFSHVSHGHPVSRDSFHVYRTDRSSPSGCMRVCSIGKGSPGAHEILAASQHGTVAGGERGEAAARA